MVSTLAGIHRIGEQMMNEAKIKNALEKRAIWETNPNQGSNASDWIYAENQLNEAEFFEYMRRYRAGNG
jgi:hypothetical protein